MEVVETQRACARVGRVFAEQYVLRDVACVTEEHPAPRARRGESKLGRPFPLREAADWAGASRVLLEYAHLGRRQPGRVAGVRLLRFRSERVEKRHEAVRGNAAQRIPAIRAGSTREEAAEVHGLDVGRAGAGGEAGLH